MCTIFVIHNKHLVVKQNLNFQFDAKYIFSTGNIAKHLFKNNSEFKTTSNANAALKFEIQIDIMATTASLLR